MLVVVGMNGEISVYIFRFYIVRRSCKHRLFFSSLYNRLCTPGALGIRLYYIYKSWL